VRRRDPRRAAEYLSQCIDAQLDGGIEVAEFDDQGLGPIYSGAQITEPIPRRAISTLPLRRSALLAP